MSRLDLKCVETAREVSKRFSKNDEKLVSDASAVLAAQGLYAFAVYLRSKSAKDDHAKTLLLECGKLLDSIQERGTRPTTPEQTNALITTIAQDLPKLLLAKRLVSETLTYLRYQIKSQP